MDMNALFKSVVDQDRVGIVLCDTEHTIVYMNPAAELQYADRGGAELVGKSILACHNPHSNEIIKKVVGWFSESPDHNIIYTYYSESKNKDIYMVALRDAEKKLIGYYEKSEFRTRESELKLYDFT